MGLSTLVTENNSLLTVHAKYEPLLATQARGGVQVDV